MSKTKDQTYLTKAGRLRPVLLGGSLLLLLLAGCANDGQNSAAAQSQAAASSVQVSEPAPAASDPAAGQASSAAWQVYTDDYLSYEIPANWSKNDGYSSDQARLAFFTPTDPASDTPSNVNLQITSLQNRSQSMDYADPEIQRLYYDFLLSGDMGLPDEAQGGTYQTEQIGDTWVYSLSFERDAGDGVMVQQTAYFPMGLDYALVIWATDFQDGSTPPVTEVARHICETLQIL